MCKLLLDLYFYDIFFNDDIFKPNGSTQMTLDSHRLHDDKYDLLNLT